MIYYAGDIHGRPNDLGRISMSAKAKKITAIVQVGDFGCLWPNNISLKFDEHLRKRAGKNEVPIYTCGGNHENWDTFLRMQVDQGDPDLVELFPGSKVYYVRRGSVITIDGIKHAFYGGAESTDVVWRTEGVSWWRDETPTKEDTERFYDNLNKHKPEVVVTHDCPTRLPLKRYTAGRVVDRNFLKTSADLENIMKYSPHLPKRWYFGHYHTLNSWNSKGVDFYCCGRHGDYQTWPESTK